MQDRFLRVDGILRLLHAFPFSSRAIERIRELDPEARCDVDMLDAPSEWLTIAAHLSEKVEEELCTVAQLLVEKAHNLLLQPPTDELDTVFDAVSPVSEPWRLAELLVSNSVKSRVVLAESNQHPHDAFLVRLGSRLLRATMFVSSQNSIERHNN